MVLRVYGSSSIQRDPGGKRGSVTRETYRVELDRQTDRQTKSGAREGCATGFIRIHVGTTSIGTYSRSRGKLRNNISGRHGRRKVLIIF
jgi:hypothetical protein